MPYQEFPDQLSLVQAIQDLILLKIIDCKHMIYPWNIDFYVTKICRMDKFELDTLNFLTMVLNKI